jgi:nicotinamidase-related amidase
VLLPKKHPSAFFGTPLASYLIDQRVDTLVVTGCTTSGCVRGSVVDAFAYNFRVLVPWDAVYDRSQVSHAVNLFDMSEKYADVMSLADALERLERLPAQGRGEAAE